MKAHARLALIALAALAACTGQDEIGTGSAALTVKSQLRGYDLGPPFPAGFRDSGLVNGYGENEWVPFVAVMEGSKLEDADALAGGVGDGRYGASIIVPSYSAKHDANAIVDLQVTGTYGEGAITPIPDPFDAHWLADNGYAPFVLGAFADTGDSDLSPRLASISQKTGPTRFGGEVGSASIPVEFQAPAGAAAVELRFAVRLARRGLEKVSPDGQGFPGTVDGTALGAADFFPGPGPIFVGYDVGEPTGIATVPIRVVRHSCQSDDECPPGRSCGDTGTCVEPCVDDSNCADDEICEDGACEPAPPLCTSDGECEVGDYCVGGYCLPPCPPEGNDACTGNDDVDGCDAEACCGGYHGESPPCVRDSQCEDGYICDDGVCEPPDTPCDVSCPEGEVCIDGTCEPPGNPCTEDSECNGGEVCVDGHCHEGEPPCAGEDCPPCSWDADCPGGEVCLEGTCHPAEPPVTCQNNGDCPANQICEDGFCDGKETCSDDSDCPNGSACDDTVDICVPEHPPIPCDGNGDCPTGDTCNQGYCTPPDTCQDDDDCYGDNVCVDNGGVELCVPPHPPIPCDGAGDCPSGDVCEAGFCAPDENGDGDGDTPPGGDQPCNNDLDCPSGECVDNGGVELCVPTHPPVPCDGDSDCPAGDACAGGFCTSDSCEDSGDCPAGTVCDNTVELCVPEHPPVPCDVDSDCPGDDACEAGFCAPPEPCQDDTDCPGGDVCVDNGGVELCVPGQPPIPCDTPADCPAPDNCGLDDVGDCEAVCVGGYCLPGGDGGGGACTSDGQCPGGYACAGGHCAPADDPVACDSQYDCGGNLCTGGFCQPGGDVVTCETAQDCYGNDDVGNETCVDGVCYDNSVDLRLCSSSTVCPAGFECSGGLCQRSEGACELDGDCADGQSCIQGWCGQLCDASCAGTCAAGRCVASCGTYSECEIGEACFSGGCVPKYALVSDQGGDPQLWVVALPGSGNITGGCQAGGGSGAGGGALLLVCAAVLGLVRRRRRHLL